MKHPFLSSALALAAFAAATAHPLAQAQANPASRKVDREELRHCLDSGDSLKARSEALKARSAQLNTLNDQLKAEGDEIQQEAERQEKNSSMLGGGRDRLDRRKATYERNVAAAKAEAAKFTPDAEALNNDLTAYNQRCGGISYSREDREAIEKERAAKK
jgi:uncharacterized protein involved in exopolysaccharide biosynthesis